MRAIRESPLRDSGKRPFMRRQYGRLTRLPLFFDTTGSKVHMPPKGGRHVRELAYGNLAKS
jgi:hypothetical protein